jgi:hypothetical protein
MFEWLFGRKIENNNLNLLDKKLKNAFNGVKKEFNEHLEAINENTNEIQSNYELFIQLDSKIDKLDARLNEIELFLKQFKTNQVYFIDDKETNSFVIQPLTADEKKAFKAIYELEAENVKITYPKLAESLAISSSLAREHVAALIEKGVPITKSYLNQNVFLSLDPKFRDIQTRNNIIGN